MRHIGLFFIFLGLVIVPFRAFSIEESSQSAPFFVHAYDSNVDLNRMGAGYEIANPQTQSRPSPCLPSVRLRDQIFEQSGLKPYISEMDDLDRDLLYLEAMNSSLGSLTAHYGRLPSALLSRLKATVKNQPEMDGP